MSPEPATVTVTVRTEGVGLTGDLALPDDATGVVLFAHGTGSSRLSPRNQAVAAHLNQAGLGTLLLDLLTAAEDLQDARSGEHRFDVDLLGRRLTGAADWLAERTTHLPVGLFGASTGAAAALMTAAERPEIVRAVVSRGGRPDLAEKWLPGVRAPVLLLVGEHDDSVLELNRLAAEALTAPAELLVIPKATHLFPEPGALEQVAEEAARWFAGMAAE
ncbi:hydrolase [Streptomyces sp. A7024]|uniref:Hydrolase n=1 Tax=Streptomyces coryli TaxID=1128680 RepID=A0A6G4TZW7_9ACTN|nr:alpha/beta family hydrolase [Streptomyces coryli]NGN64577.1 hydrolase [Streptomyces coryli]